MKIKLKPEESAQIMEIFQTTKPTDLSQDIEALWACALNAQEFDQFTPNQRSELYESKNQVKQLIALVARGMHRVKIPKQHLIS